MLVADIQELLQDHARNKTQVFLCFSSSETWLARATLQDVEDARRFEVEEEEGTSERAKQGQ